MSGVTTMTNNRLAYKGYTAAVEFSPEDMLLIGRVDDIDSLILFSAEDAATLKAEFHRAVDEYIAYCDEVGAQAERPCKGTFNIRIGSDLHRKAATAAKTHGVTLNEIVKRAVAAYVQRDVVEVHATHSVYSKQVEVTKRTIWDPKVPESDSSVIVSLASRRAYN